MSNIASILLALTILPTLVYSYDCTFDGRDTKGPKGSRGPDFKSCVPDQDSQTPKYAYSFSWSSSIPFRPLFNALAKSTPPTLMN